MNTLPSSTSRDPLAAELATELTGLMQPHAAAFKQSGTLPETAIAQMDLKMGTLLAHADTGPARGSNFGAFHRYAPVVWNAVHDFADRNSGHGGAWDPQERISPAAVKLLDTLAHCCAYWSHHSDRAHIVQEAARLAAEWTVGRMLRAEATVCQTAPCDMPPAVKHLHQLERHAADFAAGFGSHGVGDARRSYWQAVEAVAAGYAGHGPAQLAASQIVRVAKTRQGHRPAVRAAALRP